MVNDNGQRTVLPTKFMRHLLIFLQFLKYLANINLAVGRVHFILVLQLHGQISLVRVKDRFKIAAPL